MQEGGGAGETGLGAPPCKALEVRSYRRNDAATAAANPTGKLRGPNGRRLCRWCGTEVEPPRRTFCGDDCVHEWSVRQSPAYARAKVWERDRGVCTLCGTDTVKQRQELRAEFDFNERSSRPPEDRRKAFYARLKALHIPTSRWWSAGHQGCWDMDHATPVVEGGGGCGLDNLRTLCLRCHWQQTRRLRQRRSKRKRTQSHKIF